MKDAKSVNGQAISNDKRSAIQKRLDQINGDSKTKNEVLRQIEPANLEKVDKARHDLNSARQLHKQIRNQPGYAVGAFLLETQDIPQYKEVIANSMMGPDNLHPLTGERPGQLAFDLPNHNHNGRGPERVFVDVVKHGSDTRFVYADYSENHDYRNAARPQQRTYEAPQAPRAPAHELVALQQRHEEDQEEGARKKKE